MNIKPGIYWRTIRITEPLDRVDMRHGTYILPLPWTKAVVIITGTVGTLNVQQPISLWSWQGWLFGKTVSNMPSGNYGEIHG